MNPYRCEGELKTEEKSFTLALTNNAMCQLESILGINGQSEWQQRFNDEGFKEIRAQLFVMLQKFHGREFPTLDKVGNLIDDLGIVEARKAMGKVWEKHFSFVAQQIEEELKNANVSAEGEGPKGDSPG